MAASPNAQSMLNPTTALAFVSLVFIWSLTPLAIVVSVDGMHPLWGFALRFILAAPLAHLVLRLQRQSLVHNKRAYASYLAGALGTAGGMLLTYIAAPDLPSSIISMVYGLSPVVAGLIGWLYYQKPLHGLQWLGMLLSLLGLGLAVGLFDSHVHYNLKALGLMLGSMGLYVVSTYVVIGLQAQVTPLAQTTGTLWISFVVAVALMPLLSGHMPSGIPSTTALIAIAFLVVGSSVGGFMLYFNLIHTIGATNTALITVITPVLATLFGYFLLGELLHWYTFVGLFIIVAGLALYVWGQKKHNSTTAATR